MSNETPSEPITGLSPHELLLGGLDGGSGERLGVYELIEPIGEGGMGVVYLAEQHEPVQREVALKLVKRGMDTDALLARFDLERQTLAGLDHPNIARVFDAGATEAGRPYFVMELVEGVPITEFAKRGGLGRDARIGLFLQACAAVEHAHRRGVIHRDLKPSNLLVDEEGLLKVIDFGLAKLTRRGTTSGQTLAGEVFGTPGFMAPEQEAGEDVDTRADVFAMGKVLAELVDEEGELNWIAAKASDEEVARRYGSVTELAEDLRRFLEHRPLTAGPPSTFYRASKFVRRHRAGCAVAAAVVLGGGIALWKTVESARFEQKAKTAVQGQQMEWHKAHNANVFIHELLVAMDNDDPLQRREELRTAVHYYEQNLLEPSADPSGEFLVNEMLGLSYKALGELDDAMRCLDRASELGRVIDEGSPGIGVPPWHMAERSLAEVLIRKGEFDHAAGILDQLDRITTTRAGLEYPERRILLVLLSQAFDGAEMSREAVMVREGLENLGKFDLRAPPEENR